MPTKRILVALDSSPRADHVVDTAAHIAASTGAKLVLFQAVTVLPDFPRELVAAFDANLEELLLGRARATLRRQQDRLAPGVVDKIVVEFASPWDGICRAARELDVELVVLGSHGYGAIDRVLGTTAAKVVNHVDRNALVVRAAS